MRNWIAIALLLLVGSLATYVFRQEPSANQPSAAATILAAQRACEAQTGQRCD